MRTGTLYAHGPRSRHSGRFRLKLIVAFAGDKISAYSAATYDFDVWEVEDLTTGARNRLDADEIAGFADELPFQEGQTWADLQDKLTVLTLERCYQGGQGTPGGHDWTWDAVDPRGAKRVINERALFQYYGRVDGVSKPAPVATKRPATNGPCNPCGSPAFTLSRSVECTNKDCTNFVKSNP